MRGTEDCCGNCKSKAPPLIDRETGSKSCFACGFRFGSRSKEEGVKLTENDSLHCVNAQNRVSDPVSITSTEPNKASADGVVRSGLTNLQKSGCDPLSVATTESSDTSSGLGILQNPSSESVSISQMSVRLSLREKVTNRANEIFKQALVKRISETKRIAFVVACIFIACRQLNSTRSIEEISSVANGAKPSDISDAIDFIAETLSFRKDKLMDIKPADFITRFCHAVQVDGEEINVARADAKHFNKEVNSNRSPATIAAAIACHTALLYHGRMVINSLIRTSGVAEGTILETFNELYQDLSTTTPPNVSTKAKDSKNIGST